ncbi:hypothetical protein AB4166_02275 [Vibrio splendidus]
METKVVYIVPDELGETGQATAEREAKELYTDLTNKGWRNISEIRIEIHNMNVIASWTVDAITHNAANGTDLT